MVWLNLRVRCHGFSIRTVINSFLAIFPGYYTGRATHVHTKVFPTWTALPNGTFTSDQLAHVGQFFFDDEINMRVDNVSIPYVAPPLQ
jgi:hypothetical protein